MEQNYVTVNLCIFYGVQNTIAWLRRRTFTVTGWRTQKIVLWGRARRVWDADDTSPDLEGQNVLKTSEMAIRHNRRTARTELEFSVAGFIFTNVRKYFSGPLTGRNRPPPYMDRPLERERSLFTMSEHNKYTYKLDSGRLPERNNHHSWPPIHSLVHWRLVSRQGGTSDGWVQQCPSSTTTVAYLMQAAMVALVHVDGVVTGATPLGLGTAATSLAPATPSA